MRITIDKCEEERTKEKKEGRKGGREKGIKEVILLRSKLLGCIACSGIFVRAVRSPCVDPSCVEGTTSSKGHRY